MNQKTTLFITALVFFSISASAQNYWTKHDLGNRVINDFLIESPTKVWITADSTLCEFNPNNNTYGTCYDTTFLGGNPDKLIEANNRLWITTDNGLSSFDGTNFTNYTTANGLLSTTIESMAVDTSGQLWLAHGIGGVSHFNGTNFMHDSTVEAFNIAVDDSNRVFALKRFIRIHPTLGLVSVRVDTGWQQNAASGFSSNLAFVSTLIEVKKVGAKIVILDSRYSGGYYELSYPAQFDSTKAVWNELPNSSFNNNFRINDMELDANGRKWLVTDPTNGASIFSGVDSSLKPHFIYNLQGFSQADDLIETNGNSVFAFTDGNLYSSSIATEPNGKSTEEIDVNSIRTSANVNGPIFYDYFNSLPGFEMPKDSNSYGIFNANFMISSKKNGDSAFVMNQLDGFNLNLNIGPVNNTAGIGGAWITNITKQDIQNHITNYTQSGYIVPENIANWKGNGDVSAGMAIQLANFIDVNSNQIYEPNLGDYPAIKGDEAIYWINHKNKLEYHGMLYGFNNPTDSALNQSLFIDYKIINRDNVGYDSIKMGFLVDFDLGNANDDYVGCDSLNNVFFAYNGDSFDESTSGNNGFGANIPVVGVKFLSDSLDGFVTYNSSPGNNGTPSSNEGWHNYLNGKWRFGQPLVYGGDGLNGPGTTSTPTKYMYSGGNWTEDNPGGGAAANAPGDRKGLGNIPYFALQPNQSKTISMAVGYGTKANGGRLGGLNQLIKVLDSAKTTWDSAAIVLSVLESKSTETESNLILYPNPSNGSFTLKVINAQQQNESNLLEVFSVKGILVKTIEKVTPGEQLNFQELDNGMYYIRYNNAVKKLMIAK
jgi:hypothetical protein